MDLKGKKLVAIDSDDKRIGMGTIQKVDETIIYTYKNGAYKTDDAKNIQVDGDTVYMRNAKNHNTEVNASELLAKVSEHLAAKDPKSPSKPKEVKTPVKPKTFSYKGQKFKTDILDVAKRPRISVNRIKDAVFLTPELEKAINHPLAKAVIASLPKDMHNRVYARAGGTIYIPAPYVATKGSTGERRRDLKLQDEIIKTVKGIIYTTLDNLKLVASGKNMESETEMPRKKTDGSKTTATSMLKEYDTNKTFPAATAENMKTLLLAYKRLKAKM